VFFILFYIQNSMYDKIPKMFFPHHWSEDAFELEGEFLNPVKEFNEKRKTADTIIYVALLVGVILTSIGSLLWFVTRSVRLAISEKNKIRLTTQRAMEEEAVKISFLSHLKDEEMNGKGPIVINGLHPSNGRCNDNQGENNNQ